MRRQACFSGVPGQSNSLAITLAILIILPDACEGIYKSTSTIDSQ